MSWPDAFCYVGVTFAIALGIVGFFLCHFEIWLILMSEIFR